MEISLGSLLVLNNNLNALGELTGVKFAYGVAKNITLIKKELEPLEKASEPSEKFLEYDKKRLEIASKLSKKDQDGNPLVQNGQFVLEDKESFDIEIKKLADEYKEVLDARKKQLDEYNELLKTIVEIDFHLIDLEDVPKEITVSQMTVLNDLIQA